MKIIVVFGTRPEAIKLAPVLHALRRMPDVETQVVLTAQHRELVDPILDFFTIRPDYDFNIMKEAQHPAEVTTRVLERLHEVYAQQADWVVVQGDTTSAMTAALGAFHYKIPVAHIEAGLRTTNRYNPFPEEMNRRLISQLATLHCAATPSNRTNLLREGIPAENIYVTGNPVIDALQYITGQEKTTTHSPQDRRTLLLTTHRRENFGEPQRNIFEAVSAILEHHLDVEVVFPVHPNPAVQEAIQKYLPAHPRLQLLPPLDYISFVHLMNRSTLILSDSGGLQEEAPALGKPLLILRSTTERTEILESGNAILTGWAKEAIVQAVNTLLTDENAYCQMAQQRFPFGTGNAADRITQILCSEYAKRLV